MANEILQKHGTNAQLRFCDSVSFFPADNGTNWTRNAETPTNVLLTLTGVLDGEGRQSTKADLGATRARQYAVLGCVDYSGETPTAGQTIDYYWAPSTIDTQSRGNVFGNSGVDGDCPNGAVGSPTLAEFLNMCMFIGSLIVSDDAGVQNGYVGVFSPPTRWGQLIVVNNGGGDFEGDDLEMHQVLDPIIDEVQ